MKNIIPVSIPGEQKKSYPIHIGSMIMPHITHVLREEWKGYTVVVVTDAKVQKLHGNLFAKKIGAAHLFSFPSGEKSKVAETKQTLDNKLLKNKCGRNTLIIALGGGVVGDMAGFVASTYLRGVPYIQIPTTLLAMVDSSVGGKTGIDTPYGKNMIGAIWQPSAVMIDTSFLATLPEQHMQNGLLEAIKMHFICDKKMRSSVNAFLARKNSPVSLISAAVSHKVAIVQRDERERGERMILNFGHTIGHAIEKISGYTVFHGIAIGYGMLVEAHISHKLGILSSPALASLTELLKSAGIHSRSLRKWGAHAIMAATKHDKKQRDGQPLYVLLRDIGAVYRKGNMWAHPVSDSIVRKVLSNLIDESH